MDYEITLSENGTYVHVRVLTAITVDLAMRYARDAFELGEKNGIHRLLADERGAESLSSVVDKYSFAHGGGASLGLHSDWQIALLINPGNKEVEFLETVMLNAGYNFRAFTDENKAIAWLEAKTTHSPSPARDAKPGSGRTPSKA